MGIGRVARVAAVGSPKLVAGMSALSSHFVALTQLGVSRADSLSGVASLVRIAQKRIPSHPLPKRGPLGPFGPNCLVARFSSSGAARGSPPRMSGAADRQVGYVTVRPHEAGDELVAYGGPTLLVRADEVIE